MSEYFFEEIQEQLDNGEFHLLKTVAPYFEFLLSGYKEFEIRKNDRNFKQFDYVVLAEYSEEKGFSDRFVVACISCLMKETKFGLQAGYCAFGIKVVPEDEYSFCLSDWEGIKY